MGDVLSQNEIDNLLQALSSGGRGYYEYLRRTQYQHRDFEPAHDPGDV